MCLSQIKGNVFLCIAMRGLFSLLDFNLELLWVEIINVINGNNKCVENVDQIL